MSKQGRRDRVSEANGDQRIKASEQAEQNDLGKIDGLWIFELGGRACWVLVCVVIFRMVQDGGSRRPKAG